MTAATARAATGWRVPPSVPESAAQDAVALWASAQVTALDTGDAPEYGSPAWCALRANDPRRAVAIISAAEQWRHHTARETWLDNLLDEDPEEWFVVVTSDADTYARSIAGTLARQPTHDELSARRAEKKPRDVVATPGWPSIALPGRPGYRRHCGPNGEQLDLPLDQPQEMAA